MLLDPEMLIRIDENVKFIKERAEEHKKEFAEHVIEDKRIVKEFIQPLWEDRQKSLGATANKKYGGFVIDKAMTMGVAIVTAWAAVKGLKS